jgi:hypothetical protein
MRTGATGVQIAPEHAHPGKSTLTAQLAVQIRGLER